MFLLSLRCKAGLLHEHVPAFMDVTGSLLACDKFSDVRAFLLPPPLFSVLVSRQDLFYLNYNEGKRVSETGLWQIMK